MAKTPPAAPRAPKPRQRPDVPTAAPEDVIIPGKTLDLAARAAARAKAKKIGPKVKIGATTYQLPPELRLDTLRGVFKLINGDVEGLDTLLYDLFGKAAVDDPTTKELEELNAAGQAARRKAYNPAFKELTLDDIGDLFDFIGGEYGIDLGKAPDSTDS